ncbi:hypothetical protein [Mucilaginibacter arboris]|uniref:Lipoprotein n=1 Tax=Mucilaginibacter arboris TaxID=2682090 RepID=A0A7K1T037_9SPHI|nr:hypothetical protein [Mucilaginibacter arboris]MVN22913.1 hypothetical protein [Mucilaginibacter arboris]
MKNQYLIYFLLFIFLSSCSVLSDSQLKNINVYATAAKAYSDYPGEVIRHYALLNQDNRILKASSLKDLPLVLSALNSATENYQFRINQADQFDLSLKLFQQYVSLMATLSAEDYVNDLTSSSKALGESSTDLVKQYNAKASKKLPDEIGEKLSSAVFIVGKRWVKNRQAKALKEFIPAGNVLVATMVDNLVAGLEGKDAGSFKDLISLSRSDFKDKYEIIVLSEKNGINYPNLKVYYETLNRYDSLEVLRAQCVLSANKVKSCHEKLTQDIQNKKKLKTIFTESSDLIADIRKLKDAYQTFAD